MMVERMVKKGVVLLASMVVGTASAMAANVETMGIGAANTAQAGAVSAYCDNVYAAYYNPAGLTLIEKPTLSVGAIYYNAKIKVYDWEVKSPVPNDNVAKGPIDYESDTMNLVIPNSGFAMPINEKMTLGVATYAPYGLHVTWDKDPAKNPSAVYAWESKYTRYAVSPTIAYKISDKLSVGFGVSLGRSESDAGKTIEYSDTVKAGAAKKYTDAATALANNVPGVTAGMVAEAKKAAGLISVLDGAQMKLEASDDFNYSFNVGVMYRPIKELSFGLAYRGRTSTDFEGDVKISGANAVDPDTGAPIMGPDGKQATVNLDGTVTMEYDHPEQVQAGVRWFVSDKFSMEFDTTWTGWSINDKQVEEVEVTIPGVGVVPVTYEHERDWEDTISYRLGLSYAASESLTLRGGYAYDPSPIPDETFEFGWPDIDRNMFSLGLGWKITDSWALDAVLQHVRSTKKRSSTDSTELEHNYDTVYAPGAKVHLKNEGILWGLGVTMTYTF